MAEYLYKIFEEERICSSADLKSYIKRNDINQQLQIINNSNAIDFFGTNFEYESPRVNKNKIEISKCIIDLENLFFKGSSDISFIDCVFLNDIQIGGENKSSVYIDCCLFLEKLDFGPGKIEKVNIYASNVATISIVGVNIYKLDLGRSKVCNFLIKESDVKGFKARENLFDNFVVGLSKIGDVEFDHTQIPIKYFKGKNRLKYFFKKYLEDVEVKSNYNLFKFIPPDPVPLFSYFDYKTARETIGFFEEKTDISDNRNYLSELKLNKAIFTQKSIISKILVYMTGGFVKPRLFIAWGLIFYFLFSFLYMRYRQQLCVNFFTPFVS